LGWGGERLFITSPADQQPPYRCPAGQTFGPRSQYSDHQISGEYGGVFLHHPVTAQEHKKFAARCWLLDWSCRPIGRNLILKQGKHTEMIVCDGCGVIGHHADCGDTPRCTVFEVTLRREEVKTRNGRSLVMLVKP
jgi:hypothetical protein